MRINLNILSIPPYISTSWKNIASLHIEDTTLIATLINGIQIEIPQLDDPVVETIFSAHATYLEQEGKKVFPKKPSAKPLNEIGNNQVVALGLPFKDAFSLDHLGGVLQHNSAQADSPDLPHEFLTKIASLSKAIGIDNPNNLPQPEPHCNCAHCQIARALQTGATNQVEEKGAEITEELISDEELKFRTWDIQQTGEHLFSVTDPENAERHYSVYLGDPIGCTCGEKNCKHIRAVLES